MARAIKTKVGKGLKSEMGRAIKTKVGKDMQIREQLEGDVPQLLWNKATQGKKLTKEETRMFLKTFLGGTPRALPVLFLSR